MSYYGSEIDREFSRIVDYWRTRVIDAAIIGAALGFLAGVAFMWLALS